jgi:hypothetical protein
MAKAGRNAAKLTPEQYLEKLTQAYRNAFTSESGALVLDDLRKTYGRRQSFVLGAPDASAFHEGQRAVYLSIMSYLDPDQVDQEEIVPEDFA